MKKIRVLAFVIACLLVLSIPVSAAEANVRTSAFFEMTQTYLYKVSNYTFQIWFNVTATSGMDVLGVNEIKLQRSSNNSDWYTIKTYASDRYSQMLEEDTGSCVNYVSYTGMEGYYYRACVVFYAERNGSSSEMTCYTSPLYMPNV